MDAKKIAALKAAGFAVGSPAEFLGLTEAESRLVELRLALSRAVRLARASTNLTQEELATRAGSTQSRVAKAEAGALGVSLDLLFRFLFAAGGKAGDVFESLTAEVVSVISVGSCHENSSGKGRRERVSAKGAPSKKAGLRGRRTVSGKVGAKPTVAGRRAEASTPVPVA